MAEVPEQKADPWKPYNKMLSFYQKALIAGYWPMLLQAWPILNQSFVIEIG